MSETVASSISGQSFADAISYDLDGNRVSMSHVAGGTTDTTTYSYNGDNELTSQTDSQSGTTTFGYDANGSLTSATNNGTVVASYTYNVQNEMVSATVNGVTSSDVYDDNGDRVEETVNGTSTYYLYDDNNPTGYDQVIEAKSSPTAAPSMSYILGLGIIGQANSSGTVSYFLTDGQGSTRALVNSSGVVTATFNYDANGNLLGITYTPSSPPPTVYLYDQQQLDVALGQYQLRARIYNPQTGEFDSFDPMTHEPGDVLGANPYIYADDDAPNMDDPTGMGAVFNALLGTAVHSFLNRAFEGFTGITPGFPAIGGAPGARLPVGPGRSGSIQRWSNRWISSIGAGNLSPGSVNRLRPDFVEVNTATTPRSGDLYELKPISAVDLASGTSASMAASLALYYGALRFSVPTVSWSLGTTWAPGVTAWPTFTSPLMPPGSTLVTIDNYSVMPGAIFYDIVGVDDVAELAAAAVSGITAAALMSVTLGSVDAAAGLAAEEAPAVAGFIGPELEADLGEDVMIDSLAA
jgi:RHS repeat-associated protein